MQGMRTDLAFVQVWRDLSKFHVFDTGGTELALAQNYRALRGQGRTVRKTIDCLIATFCLDARHSLFCIATMISTHLSAILVCVWYTRNAMGRSRR